MTVLNTETRRALRLAINQRRRELVADDGPVPDPYHGTHASYRNGCRCDQVPRLYEHVHAHTPAPGHGAPARRLAGRARA